MAESTLVKPKNTVMWLKLAGTLILGFALAVGLKHLIDVHVLGAKNVPTGGMFGLAGGGPLAADADASDRQDDVNLTGTKSTFLVGGKGGFPAGSKH